MDACVGMVAIDRGRHGAIPTFNAVDWVLGGVVDPAELAQGIEGLSALLPELSPYRLLGWCRALAALVAIPRICKRRDDSEIEFLVTPARG